PKAGGSSLYSNVISVLSINFPPYAHFSKTELLFLSKHGLSEENFSTRLAKSKSISIRLRQTYDFQSVLSVF
ncbi:MAG: hypothetical protein IIV62_00110, partial [Anaerotignum sp.]|nr:hypothetical protein [Anaerotignum sp.]